jgi:hypothetical protein
MMAHDDYADLHSLEYQGRVLVHPHTARGHLFLRAALGTEVMLEHDLSNTHPEVDRERWTILSVQAELEGLTIQHQIHVETNKN